MLMGEIERQFSTPGSPTLKTRFGFSPSWIIRFCRLLAAWEMQKAHFRIQWRKVSSKAPSVISPPEICAIAIPRIAAVAVAANIS
jgi:hypothetical protein